MLKVFYSEKHRLHSPPFEVFDGGLRVPYFESPERVERVLEALRQSDWAEFHKSREFGLEPILAVHDPAYVEFLTSAWEEWQAVEPDPVFGSDRSALLPATFALRGQSHLPASLLGRAGYYMMDLSAPIVEGTYAAARASADCALSAASVISTGERAAFALTRPPGHHAGKSHCGGYCYLNNAAIAAQHLSRKGKTALLDIDYHAGNGTQEIFYERRDVLSLSIHADPAWEYPHFAGYAEEIGAGAGEGFHHNFPLPAGTDDPAYLATLDRTLSVIRDYQPTSLVVSAGMDIYTSDPLGRIKITTGGIGEIGRRIAALGVPTAIIMEGGYNNNSLGVNFVSFLETFR